MIFKMLRIIMINIILKVLMIIKIIMKIMKIMIFYLWWSLRAMTKEAFDRHFCSRSILPADKIVVIMMIMV